MNKGTGLLAIKMQGTNRTVGRRECVIKERENTQGEDAKIRNGMEKKKREREREKRVSEYNISTAVTGSTYEYEHVVAVILFVFFIVSNDIGSFAS